MENQNSNSGLKAVIVILALLLSGSLFYIYSLTKEAKILSNQIVTEKSGKENVMDSLSILRDTYDSALEDKTAMSDDLVVEREKVINLMAELKKSKGDPASISKYRKQLSQLQNNMKSLIAENDALKIQNKTLQTQRDSTVEIAGRQKKFIDTLSIQNEKLASTVAKGSKLSITNLKTQAFWTSPSDI